MPSRDLKTDIIKLNQTITRWNNKIVLKIKVIFKCIIVFDQFFTSQENWKNLNNIHYHINFSLI